VVKTIPQIVKTGIKEAAPKIKASGGDIVKILKQGIVSILPSYMGGIANQIFDSIGNLGMPAFEIMFLNDAIRTMVREGKIHQIDNVIATSMADGMISMNN
ncbi:type IV pilus twitching motility protein PilT, partial [[Clostridium] symbiosum]|nr:type IV pilus twitching motility protein PilT [[Clostridium] symbiosum]